MKNMKCKHYCPEEIAIIKKYYEVIGAKKTAEVLRQAGFDRTWKAVGNKAFYMGLKSPLYQAPNPGGFKKGHVPANKGKKMQKEVYEKAKPTMFTAGHKPHNTKRKGDISIRIKKSGRPYKYIKISDGHWELLHRHLWKKQHGSIPRKHVLIFKDGDSLNCSLDNLQLITMAENMQRNRNYEKFKKNWEQPSDAQVIGRMVLKFPGIREELQKHPDLIETARQTIILNREIKKQKNGE
jgi:hypothetical protein